MTVDTEYEIEYAKSRVYQATAWALGRAIARGETAEARNTLQFFKIELARAFEAADSEFDKGKFYAEAFETQSKAEPTANADPNVSLTTPYDGEGG